LNPEQVLDYYIHAGDGSVVLPVRLHAFDTSTVPSINHFSAVEFGRPSRVRPEFPRPMH